MFLGSSGAGREQTALKLVKMFRRTRERQDQNRQQVPEIRGRQEAAPAEIGNEALSHYLESDLNLIGTGSHKANNGQNKGPEPEKAVEAVLPLINEIAEKNPDAVSEIAENEEQNRNVPEDIAGDGLTDYYNNDLNRLDPKKEKAGKKNKESGNIMNDDDVSVADSQFEPELLSIGSRRSSFSMKGGNADDLSEDFDLEEAEEDMRPVDGWGFAAEKMSERTKPSFWKKLGSAAAYYGGKFVGKIGGIIFNLVNYLTCGTFTGINSWKALWKGTFSRKRDYQQGRNRKAIPGWDGARFEERSKYDIDIDLRRVPDIWAYPIAEDPKDEEGREKPPVISVNINQTSKDLTLNENEESGHSGIGIEFNRKNPRTGELERYGLRYGYYLGGGLTSTSANAVSNYNNANYPGQLRDERRDSYTVSCRFKANARQVNAVLNASEKYPDKGYNPYTRNCTTFARDMIVDTANIRQAAPIFEKVDVNMPAALDRKMFGAGAMAPLFKAEMENTMDKLAHRDDMNYQGFGNKMVTKEDYNRYKKSLKIFTLRPDKAHVPNASAENIRRLEGPGTGEIGAFPYKMKDAQNNELDSSDKSALNKSLMSSGSYIKNLLTTITPAEDLAEGKIPDDLQRIIGNLDKLYIPMLTLLSRDADLVNVSQKNIRKVRTTLSGYVTDLNKLLFKYYKNDRRLHEPVLNTISTLSQLIYSLDVSWRKKRAEDETNLDRQDDDLGNIRYEFNNELYVFRVNGKKLAVSPSRYESLLQVYKSPKAALENYLRFIELYNKGENDRDEDEEKEFSKLTRMRELVDDFDKSHRYMLDKQEYSQQDVDYAFALGNKERKPEGPYNEVPRSEIFGDGGHTASSTYKMLIIQKIFGGMKNRFKAEKQNDWTKKQIVNWLEQDSLKFIEQSPDQMKMVIRGIKRSLKDPDPKTVREKVFDLLENWFRRIMSDRLKDDHIAEIRSDLEDHWHPLYKKIASLTKAVLGEAEDASLNEEQERILN